MAFSVEDAKDFVVYRIEGFFSFQDIEAIIEKFDKLIEDDSSARIILDFSDQTGYEETTIKAAFNRIDQGFPRTLKVAIVYSGQGSIYKHVLSSMAASMPEISKFFPNRAEAEAWLHS